MASEARRDVTTTLCSLCSVHKDKGNVIPYKAAGNCTGLKGNKRFIL